MSLDNEYDVFFMFSDICDISTEAMAIERGVVPVNMVIVPYLCDSLPVGLDRWISVVISSARNRW